MYYRVILFFLGYYHNIRITFFPIGVSRFGMGHYGLTIHRARAAVTPVGVGRIDGVGDDYASGDGTRSGIAPCGV